MVRETEHAGPTTTPPQRDVHPVQKQALTDQFKLLDAGGGKKDTLITVGMNPLWRGVWILEGSLWVQQCEVPKDLPDNGVCFCAVAGGFLAIGGVIENYTSPLCYHFSLSGRRWRKLPDMIKPKRRAEAVKISPMLVMVIGGYDDEDNYTNTCEILDMKRGAWFSVEPLPGHIAKVRVAATDGRVFIMGQYGDSSAPNYQLLEYQPASDTYQPASDTYTTVQIDRPELNDLDFISSHMAAVAGKLYLVGRINIEYDITTQHVTQLPKPNDNINWSECCATVRGKSILLCGGYDNEHSDNVMEEYNTTTKQWKMLDVSLPFAIFSGQSFVVNISI